MNSRYENHIPIVNPTKISIPIIVPIVGVSFLLMVTGNGDYVALLWSTEVGKGNTERLSASQVTVTATARQVPEITYPVPWQALRETASAIPDPEQ
jgi:hypothetical protein